MKREWDRPDTLVVLFLLLVAVVFSTWDVVELAETAFTVDNRAD